MNKIQDYVKTKYGYSISIKSIVDQVNALDEKYNVDLKRPRLYNQPDQLYISTLDAGYEYIDNIICSLNGTDQITSSFYDQSILDWSKPYDIASSQFILKFLTILLMEYKNQIEIIVENKIDMMGRLLTKEADMYKELRTLLFDINRLVILMINDKEYKNSLLKVYFNLTNICKIEKTVKKCNSRAYYSRNEILAWFYELEETEDIVVYMISRLSYILATGNGGIKKFIEFEDLDGCNINNNFYDLVKELGKRIMNKSREDYHLLYKIFIRANPKIITNYPEEDVRKKVQIGLLSLYFTAFICNDYDAYKFIKLLVK